MINLECSQTRSSGWSRRTPAAPGRDVSDLWRSLPTHRDTTPDFYTFINSTRTEAEPFLLVCHDIVPVALLVGRIEVRHIRFSLGYLTLKGPRMRILDIIPGGLVGSIDTTQAEKAFALLQNMLACRELDAVVLHHADPITPLFKEMATSPGFLMRDRCVTQHVHRFRKLDGKLDFFSTISANERSQQRKRHRRLLESGSGDVRVDAFDEPASLDRLLIDAEHVASRSYQRGLGVGFARSSSVERRLDWLARKSWLRAWIVYVGSVPVAFWIGTLERGVFVSDYLAYDEAFVHLAPGTFLTIFVLAELQNSHADVDLVDFGPGEAAYKQRYGNDASFCSSVYLFPNRIDAFFVNLCRTIVHLVGVFLKARLVRHGRLAKLKKHLRGFTWHRRGVLKN